MAAQDAFQADAGSQGLAGLGAYSKVLATLSADGIHPMAIIQLEQLGAVFHVNGRYAAQVPELLNRLVSRPVGQLPTMVGWRRGDSASVLAQSAGGQAVSLLSFCLKNMYTDSAVGQILSELCGALLPTSFPAANHSQLAEVGDRLGDKLNRLGFGNLLAQQALRVLTIYEGLGVKQPDDLFESPCAVSMAGVLAALKHLADDDAIITISGSLGMVHILTILLFMFPEDVVATVETCIIHQGPKSKLVVEFVRSGSTSIQVSKTLNQSPFLHLPIKACTCTPKAASEASFEWNGWLARKLQLELAILGFVCSEPLLVACCDMLIQLAYNNPRGNVTAGHTALPAGGVATLLGPFCESRMKHACETLFLATPSRLGALAQSDLPEAWADFESIVRHMAKVHCSCQRCHFQHELATATSCDAQDSCPYRKLWTCIRSVLNAGLYCLASHTSGPVAITGRLKSLGWDITTDNIDAPLTSDYILSTMRLVSGVTDCGGSIGVSSGGCTIYPTVLDSLEAHPDGVFSFELIDGMFMFEGQYHTTLRCSGEGRIRTETSLVGSSSPIIPSSVGDFSDISLTLRQGWKELVMSCTLQVSDHYIHVELLPVLESYVSLERTQPCEHGYDEPLDESLRESVLVTGVTSPAAFGEKTALAMVRSNPVAQLLCCEPGVRCLLVQRCCLNCALKQAKAPDVPFKILIVT